MPRRCYFHGHFGGCDGKLIQAPVPPSKGHSLESFVSPTFYCEAHLRGARMRGVLQGQGLGLRPSGGRAMTVVRQASGERE